MSGYDPDAILADPNAHPVHKLYAEINVGIRDRGEAREEMHRLFAEELVRAGVRVVPVAGLGRGRTDEAAAAVAEALARRSAGAASAG